MLHPLSIEVFVFGPTPNGKRFFCFDFSRSHPSQGCFHQSTLKYRVLSNEVNRSEKASVVKGVYTLRLNYCYFSTLRMMWDWTLGGLSKQGNLPMPRIHPYLSWWYTGSPLVFTIPHNILFIDLTFSYLASIEPHRSYNNPLWDQTSLLARF